MQNPMKTEAIKAFLVAFAPSDLAALYNYNMEVQVTVAKDKGNRIEGDFKGRHWQGYTDGITTWKPLRIPLNAMSEPSWTDTPMTYDLLQHAEGIGMTGWDWVNRNSCWVAYDFDAITGHSDKHRRKLDDLEIVRITELFMTIPWVTIRKSTGGKGRHVYVFLEPTRTENHTEHAAIARAVLSQLSGLARFDFSIKVDTCGGNMWVWHRKLLGTDGLSLIKEGTELCQVPQNWKDYTPVITGRRQKNLPWFIDEQKAAKDDIEDIFDSLTGQRLRIPLDSEHIRVMTWVRENYPNAVWWDAEHHMLVTHTSILKEAHTDLSLKGKFDTNAKGSEKGHDHNCFAFPISRGGWALRRYALGVEEHPSWEQDGSGWTRCFFNREADLGSAARANGGIEKSGGGYFFATAEDAAKVAVLLGANVNLKNHVLMQNAKLKLDKSGKLLFTIVLGPGMPGMDGWIIEGKKCERMFSIRNPGPAEPEVMRLDDQVRHIMTESGEDCGWVINSESCWHEEPYQHVKAYLGSLGYKPNEVVNIMGSSISQCWKIVNKPFEEQYPANREWNRKAAQLRYQPTVDRDNLKYPTWLSVLQHCGSGLDDAVLHNPWCKNSGILTGSDYLKCWIASLLQCPKEPLPYLFFYSSDQNTGKSTFHEAISLLMTNGVERADTALTSQGNFNGELENKVVCVVEETDLRKNVTAYNRIKDWVTSRMLPIHMKGRTPYQVPNTSHWIQCANSHLYCPVFPGDTRITMCYVKPFDGDIIPKREIILRLEAEAPDFLAEVLNLEIPPSNDRLNIPIIQTEDKKLNEYANQSFLEMFLVEKCYPAPGYLVMFSDFCDRFKEWIDPNQASEWTKIRIGREMPPQFPKGRLTNKNGAVAIGNISFTEIAEADHLAKYVTQDGWLMQVAGRTDIAQPVENPLEEVQKIVGTM